MKCQALIINRIINKIKPKLKNKYGAKRTVADGITFHSSREAKRYGELKLLQQARMISDLELQPRYRIEVNGVLICTYVADFRYTENGKTIVEDVKGYRTELYKLKAKLIKAIYGIDILET